MATYTRCEPFLWSRPSHRRLSENRINGPQSLSTLSPGIVEYENEATAKEAYRMELIITKQGAVAFLFWVSSWNRKKRQKKNKIEKMSVLCYSSTLLLFIFFRQAPSLQWACRNHTGRLDQLWQLLRDIYNQCCFLSLFSHEQIRCLVKNPDERATATELLQHEFIGMAQPASILSQMIAEAKEIRENLVYRLTGKQVAESVIWFLHSNESDRKWVHSKGTIIFDRMTMKLTVGRWSTHRPTKER